MTYEDREQFRTGRKVNDAMAQKRIATLRPTEEQINDAAQALGITTAAAWKAWNTYTWTVD